VTFSIFKALLRSPRRESYLKKLLGTMIYILRSARKMQMRSGKRRTNGRAHWSLSSVRARWPPPSRSPAGCLFEERCANEKQLLLSPDVADYLLAMQSIPTASTTKRYTKRRGKTHWIARFGTTHGSSGHHRGDELMLMSEHGDSSKLINAS